MLPGLGQREIINAVLGGASDLWAAGESWTGGIPQLHGALTDRDKGQQMLDEIQVNRKRLPEFSTPIIDSAIQAVMPEAVSGTMEDPNLQVGMQYLLPMIAPSLARAGKAFRNKPDNSITGPVNKQSGHIKMFDDPQKMRKVDAQGLPWEERGVWHPVGLDRKMKKPIDDMSRGVIEINKPQISQMNIESLKDAYLIGLLGDRTDAGKLLTHIGDLKLDEPLRLEGGRGFMWDNPESAWASGQNVITKLRNSILEAKEMGRRPVGVFMPTKHDASNFNNMLTDTVLQMIRSSDLEPKTLNSFNAELRSTRPEWEGIDDPDSMRKLETNGALRHEFNRIAGLRKYQDEGFPDFDEARFAITDPKLMHRPIHESGMGFGEFTGKVVDNPIQPHRTYPIQLEGSYLGELDFGLPRDFFWRDWKNKKVMEGKTTANQRSASAAKYHPTQVVDQQWIDMIMKALQ